MASNGIFPASGIVSVNTAIAVLIFGAIVAEVAIAIKAAQEGVIGAPVALLGFVVLILIAGFILLLIDRIQLGQR